MAEAGRTYTGLVLDGLARDPERVALRCGGVTLTAQECLDAVYRMARALDRAGLGRGDGVTVLAGNTPEALLVRLAANQLGCRVAMPHSDGPAADLVALAAFAETTALVYDPLRCGPSAEAVARALPAAGVFALGPAVPGGARRCPAGRTSARTCWSSPRACSPPRWSRATGPRT
ncbi:AMP-binding protein [Kitasatospora sp. NPDC053057]|uniref:AMP-binding protein n=1 Tax=Kitasatospora sp. NPDC053057 TaxID=3364062 RepID=UPI0037C55208